MCENKFENIDQDGSLEIIETMIKTTLTRTETYGSVRGRYDTYIPIATKKQKTYYRIIF